MERLGAWAICRASVASVADGAKCAAQSPVDGYAYRHHPGFLVYASMGHSGPAQPPVGTAMTMNPLSRLARTVPAVAALAALALAPRLEGVVTTVPYNAGPGPG